MNSFLRGDHAASPALADHVEIADFSESAMSFLSHLENVEKEEIQILNKHMPQNAVRILQKLEQRECFITEEQNIATKAKCQRAFHDKSLRNTINQLTKLMKTAEVVNDSNNMSQTTAKMSRKEMWIR